jgi:hypothetical protein
MEPAAIRFWGTGVFTNAPQWGRGHGVMSVNDHGESRLVCALSTRLGPDMESTPRNWNHT